jgi:hypothetical protein
MIGLLLFLTLTCALGLWLTTNLATYPTPTSGSGGIHSLATSSTWTAGYEWFVIDNTTEKALDYFVQGVVRVGTSPTASTEIRLYLVASYDGSTWPDVFDGTPSAETVTSAGVRDSFAKLAALLQVDATTSDRDYPFAYSVAAFFNGVMPKKVAVFVAHNTGVNLNSTSGNQTYNYAPFDTTNG